MDPAPPMDHRCVMSFPLLSPAAPINRRAHHHMSPRDRQLDAMPTKRICQPGKPFIIITRGTTVFDYHFAAAR
ncbi:hypothetical protein BRAS3843_1100039 [Bradyrhizobium sp. STM 3843]|nr:hypothetical protein BRAS3843_1100039 [Bradyrhizobium sp. STM 3843]